MLEHEADQLTLSVSKILLSILHLVPITVFIAALSLWSAKKSWHFSLHWTDLNENNIHYIRDKMIPKQIKEASEIHYYCTEKPIHALKAFESFSVPSTVHLKSIEFLSELQSYNFLTSTTLASVSIKQKLQHGQDINYVKIRIQSFCQELFNSHGET